MDTTFDFHFQLTLMKRTVVDGVVNDDDVAAAVVDSVAVDLVVAEAVAGFAMTGAVVASVVVVWNVAKGHAFAFSLPKKLSTCKMDMTLDLTRPLNLNLTRAKRYLNYVVAVVSVVPVARSAAC